VRTWLATAARVILAVVLGYAGVRTIGDPARTLTAVRAYSVLPGWLSRGVAYGLPYLLLALAVLLLLGLAVRVAAAVSAAVLALFLVLAIAAAARGLRIGCGCFGGGGTLPAGQSAPYAAEFVAGAVLLLAALALAMRPATRFALDDRLRRPPVVAATRGGPRKSAEARRRQAELAAAQEAAAARRARLAGVLAVVLLVVVTGAGVAIGAGRGSGGGVPAAQAVSVTDGVQLGRPGARTTIDIYEDARCTSCAVLENQARGQLTSWIDTSTARVRYYVVALLDPAPSRASSAPPDPTARYSARAAAASYCAADVGAFAEFHELLFGNGPAIGDEALTDDQLIALGAAAGIAPGAAQDRFRTCVTSKKYASFVGSITEQAQQDGVLGTPTVLVGGNPVSNPDLTKITDAVNAAL
jgi:protein-disulfide isomerase